MVGKLVLRTILVATLLYTGSNSTHMLASPVLSNGIQQRQLPNSQYFEATGHSVSAEFLGYWQENGGLPTFGYPLTDRVLEGNLEVQYFERAIFELHPENSPPHNVLLRRLGWTATDGKHSQPPFQTAQQIQSPNCLYFPETGHNLCAGFRDFWQEFGGLAVNGFPISEEFREAVAETGKTYIVQFFERQRFEWHPGEWPQRHDVLLGRLGAVALDKTGPGTPINRIELPASNSQVTLPVHIQARLERPDMQVTARLRWEDSTTLTNTFTTLRGKDGHGLIIDNLDWKREGAPPMPGTQSATLDLIDQQGVVLATQKLTVLSHDDPDVDKVKVYWLLSDPPVVRLQDITRSIPRTVSVGSAALEELLWGPAPPNLAGFTTAIPTPKEVLSYVGRTPDWGERVTLLGLNIKDGIATADFSKEMRAYGGGSARVQAIREQITSTLKQFSTVSEVRIAIEGATRGVLEP